MSYNIDSQLPREVFAQCLQSAQITKPAIRHAQEAMVSKISRMLSHTLIYNCG